MPIVNVKLSPPVYNSDRDVPPYAEWYEKFLQFVAYNHGGDAIIALINCALGREDTIYIHETSAIPDALRLGQAEVEQMLALTAGGGERAVESYADLDQLYLMSPRNNSWKTPKSFANAWSTFKDLQE